MAADPPKSSALAAKPGGWAGLRYWRLHGAPRTYYSEYTREALDAFGSSIRESSTRLTKQTWVIFDNTALGHATENAWEMQKLLECKPDKPLTAMRS